MSRSRKKAWITSKNRTKKLDKKFANKKVKNSKDVPNGKAYRKYYESYRIIDWKYFTGLEKDKRK